jgi:2-methylcitrate dehydratase PrpD
MSPLTQAYADFAERVSRGALPLPTAALAVAGTGFVDAVGVMAAGAAEPVVQVLAGLAQEEGGAAQSALALHTARVPAAMAACVNATAAHALDFDDFAFSNHPSAVLVPTLLAAAQASPAPVTGRQLLHAYVAGYEVWADAFVRESDLYYDQGWHPTSVFGTLGAAVATSIVWGLDATRIRHALALAASASGGVFENFGTMAKPWHGGRAAQVGVHSARLAQRGLQASATAIEGPHGMLRAFSPKGAVDRERPFVPGEPWQILKFRLNLKRYPVVGAAQRGIDAMLGLRETTLVAPPRVRRIVAHISRRHAAVMPYHRPQDSLQAKFSLEFALACALVHGQVGLAQLHDEVVRDPEIQRLVQAVEIETTEDFEPGWRDAAPFDQVILTLDDGTTVASPQIRRPLGHADRPLDRGQVAEKCLANLGHAGLEPTVAQGLLHALDHLINCDDVRALPWPVAGGR